MLIENRTFSALIGLVIAFVISTISSYFLLQPSAEALVLRNTELNQVKVAYKQLKIENNDLKRQLQAVETPLDIAAPSLPKPLNEFDSSPTFVDNQLKAESPEDLQVGIFSSVSMLLVGAIASTPQLAQLSIVSGFDYGRAALEIYPPRNPDLNLLQ